MKNLFVRFCFGIASIFLLSSIAPELHAQYALGDGHALDRNPSIYGRYNYTRDPLRGYQMPYRIREDFGIHPPDRRFYRDGLRFADEFQTRPDLRSGLYDYRSSSSRYIYSQQIRSQQQMEIDRAEHERRLALSLLRSVEANNRRFPIPQGR
jgi:hypothetical protein